MSELQHKEAKITAINVPPQNKFKDLYANRYPQYDLMFHEASLETNLDKNLLNFVEFSTMVFIMMLLSIIILLLIQLCLSLYFL